jgi:hypothetical protein
MNPIRIALALLASITATTLAQTSPVGGEFVYQGVLKLDGQPVTEPILVSFTLFANPDGVGDFLGREILRIIDPDDQGVFSVELKFGIASNADQRYLRITLIDAPGSTPGPLPLSPLTKITAVPVADYALDAPAPPLEEVTDGRVTSVPDAFLEIEASPTYTRGILLKGPADTIYAIPGIRAAETFTIESTAGDLALIADGTIDLVSAGNTRLASGNSLLTLAPSRVDIDAASVDIDASISAKFSSGVNITIESLATTIRGNGSLSLNGAFIQMTGPTLINGHNFSSGIVQLTGILRTNTDAFKPGGGPWGVLSDARTKHQITPLTGSLNTLRGLRPVRFEYNNPHHPLYAPGTQHGFIAQQVRQILPDWITTDDTGTLMLTPRGFEALVINAIQELESSHQRQLERLRQENDQLRLRLDRLESLLHASPPR